MVATVARPVRRDLVSRIFFEFVRRGLVVVEVTDPDADGTFGNDPDRERSRRGTTAAAHLTHLDGHEALLPSGATFHTLSRTAAVPRTSDVNSRAGFSYT